MLRYQFPGRVYPVHPKREQIQGVKAYPSLTDIPDEVELAVVAVSAALTEAVVIEGIDKGIRAFVVFGSGYAELNEAGRLAQQRLATLCEDNDALLLGPNCIGCADSHSKADCIVFDRNGNIYFATGPLWTGDTKWCTGFVLSGDAGSSGAGFQ